MRPGAPPRSRKYVFTGPGEVSWLVTDPHGTPVTPCFNKMYKNEPPAKFYACSDVPHTHPHTHRCFYKQFHPQCLLHADAFTHRHFCTQTLLPSHPSHTQTHLHANAFTHMFFTTRTLLHNNHFYTQTRLHANAFTHKLFYTQTLLTQPFTHKLFYTQTLLTQPFTHKHFYTQTLLHTDALTHRPFCAQAPFTHKHVYTQTLWRTKACTHKRFYPQTLWHTNTSTHEPFYTQTLLHTNALTHKRFERGGAKDVKSQKETQFLTLEPRFVRNGSRGSCKIAKTLSFWLSNLISCKRVAISWRLVGTACGLKREKNELRWYPQQPQRFIFTNLSEALRRQALETPQPGFRELNGCKSCWTWPGSAPKPPRPSPEPSPEPSPKPSPEPSPELCTKAFRNLPWNLLRNPVKPNLPLHRPVNNVFNNRFHNLTTAISLPKPWSEHERKTTVFLCSVFKIRSSIVFSMRFGNVE